MSDELEELMKQLDLTVETQMGPEKNKAKTPTPQEEVKTLQEEVKTLQEDLQGDLGLPEEFWKSMDVLFDSLPAVLPEEPKAEDTPAAPPEEPKVEDTLPPLPLTPPPPLPEPEKPKPQPPARPSEKAPGFSGKVDLTVVADKRHADTFESRNAFEAAMKEAHPVLGKVAEDAFKEAAKSPNKFFTKNSEKVEDSEGKGAPLPLEFSLTIQEGGNTAKARLDFVMSKLIAMNTDMVESLKKNNSKCNFIQASTLVLLYPSGDSLSDLANVVKALYPEAKTGSITRVNPRMGVGKPTLEVLNGQSFAEVEAALKATKTDKNIKDGGRPSKADDQSKTGNQVTAIADLLANKEKYKDPNVDKAADEALQSVLKGLEERDPAMLKAIQDVLATM